MGVFHNVCKPCPLHIGSVCSDNSGCWVYWTIIVRIQNDWGYSVGTLRRMVDWQYRVGDVHSDAFNCSWVSTMIQPITDKYPHSLNTYVEARELAKYRYTEI